MKPVLDFLAGLGISGELAAAIVAGAALAALAGFGIWKYARKQPGPEELERRRRLALNETGKLGDGEVIDVEGAVIVYSYLVAGVSYTASQDVATIESLLPEDHMQVLGPVGIKFDPRNPANSIVICEDWNGIARPRGVRPGPRIGKSVE